MSGKRMTGATERAVCAGKARTVSMLFVCMLTVMAGCKRRAGQGEGQGEQSTEPVLETVITNRMQDPVYVKALVESRREQTQAAAARSVVVEKMEAMIAEARASLPPGADDEAVKKELAKRPEWKTLEAENERAMAEIKKAMQAAREKVRQRVEAEACDVKAVAEGRAVPATPQGQQKE